MADPLFFRKVWVSGAGGAVLLHLVFKSIHKESVARETPGRVGGLEGRLGGASQHGGGRVGAVVCGKVNSSHRDWKDQRKEPAGEITCTSGTKGRRLSCPGAHLPPRKPEALLKVLR